MDKQIAEKILSLTLSHKADMAEVFLRSSVSSSIEVKDQQVDAYDRSKDIGAGLRIIVDGRLGFAFTTDLTNGSLAKMAKDAVTNAQNTEQDPFNALPERPSGSYQPVNIYDPGLANLDVEEQIARVMAMEREAFGVDKRIKRIRKASARFAASETVLLNTRGIEVSYRGTAAFSSIEVVAEEGGESQAGWEADASRFYARLEMEEVARRAARRALGLLGARSIVSVKAPVILERTVAEEILSLIASGLSAESIQKRRSLFLGKLGKSVMSPLVTVYDDGMLEGGIGTTPADDEGVPVRKKTIIEGGRLVRVLHNTYTAGKEGTVSTGNAVRGGFKGLPGVGVTNLYIEPGAASPEDVIAGTERGLYVLEIMGAHTANPISGDFSVGASGFWIEGGKLSYPVREVTIAGNILELMNAVDAVCNDLKFSGRIGSPTLRIKELSIAGK